MTPDATFLEIGFDSLFLTQAASALQKQFATEITLRTLLEDAPTLNLLVERILPTLPEDVLPEPRRPRCPQLAMTADAGSLAGIAQQLAIISRQLEMLGVRPGAAVPTIPTAAPAPAPEAATPAPINHSTVPARSTVGACTVRRIATRASRSCVRHCSLPSSSARLPLEAAGTRTPIFAVGGHNGDVFTYRALALHLGPDQPFFGLQPPGLEEGSQPLTRSKT